MKEKEELYLKAKTSYYSGNPIMSDYEFDLLEEELKAFNSNIINIVGDLNNKNDKIFHLTPMKSLSKIQYTKTYEPLNEYHNFITKINDCSFSEVEESLEVTPKFDGNACNLIYENGKLIKAISRGDGTKGQDLTLKIKNIVPNEISIKDKLEIRGEILIKNSIFDLYFSNYKNPRNFVAGLLGRDEINYDNLNKLNFLAFEIKIKVNNQIIYPYSTLERLSLMGFNKEEIFTLNHSTRLPKDSLNYIFDKFRNYRQNCDYLLDGFVLKSKETIRNYLGETTHHPKWALAVKFPPKSVITKLIDIEWNLGKTGYLTPVGILEPIDLDGSTVSRVTLHNYEWIKNKKVSPGAIVEIVKSGDIIPAIINVIKESTSEFKIPETFKGLPTKIKDGKHLEVLGVKDLDEFAANKLYKGISILELQYIGPAISLRLYNAGISNIMELFNKKLMNGNNLSENGDFKLNSRELERLLLELNSFNKIELWKLIHSLQFERVGSSLSKKIAYYLAGDNVDWSGFEKAVVDKFTISNSDYINNINTFIQLLNNNNIEIILPKKIDNKLQTFELTGSPKDFGFKTKSLFLEFANKLGFRHDKLTKDSKYLITDSYDAVSSKMKKANKLGIEIITYGDFEKKYS